MWLMLRSRVPAPVRAVAPTERRLAWGLTEDDVPLVATPTALYVGDTALAWADVETAGWAPPVLTVREVAEVSGAGRAHRFVVATDSRLVETVRACVTSSVAWSDVRRLQPDGKVRVVGRRTPGRDALTWQVVFLEGTDPSDPLLRMQADQAVAELRASLG